MHALIPNMRDGLNIEQEEFITLVGAAKLTRETQIMSRFHANLIKSRRDVLFIDINTDNLRKASLGATCGFGFGILALSNNLRGDDYANI